MTINRSNAILPSELVLRLVSGAAVLCGDLLKMAHFDALH
jgi:hypothetical protein